MPITTEQTIEKFRRVHGYLYDYSLVNYTTAKNKVQVICKVHGEFLTTPNNHLTGHGCPKCSGKGLTHQELIDKMIGVHVDKYVYHTEFKDCYTKTPVGCPTHGDFLVSRNNHLKGHGCPKCGKNTAHEKTRLPLEKFIEKSISVHGDIYDYSQVDYIGAHKNVQIICKAHGAFSVTPANHWSNESGCPQCCRSNMTKGERKIAKWLDEVGIKYTTQKTFPGLFITDKRYPLKYDFYIESHNMLIEYDGEHHHRPVAFCEAQKNDVGRMFELVKERDRVKTEFAETNGITLSRISYLDDIKSRLVESFCST